ncbi:MAG: C4-type zinc ribbon domain-containing protein [Anaerolineales bacterium]|nr:C4-type zinc ribbon domain-containing protein [Anaerolineales bacterium]MDW8162766.1 C4-type zinc ribbon domain-containing protein [Anaerolineales bacterium]
MSQIFKLYRLQQIDSQLDQARSRLSELVRLLENDSDLRQAQENFDRQEKVVRDLEKQLRLLEHNVEQQTSKIQECETELYSGRIKNPKRLKELEDEVKALKRHLQLLEERQLESMLTLEEETQVLHDFQHHLNSIKQNVYQRNSRYLGEKTELEKEIQRLENERALAVSSLASEFYARYLAIREAKKGIAVCRVQDRSCTACGTTLTGGLIQESRLPDRLTYCPSCGRILYGG